LTFCVLQSTSLSEICWNTTPDLACDSDDIYACKLDCLLHLQDFAIHMEVHASLGGSLSRWEGSIYPSMFAPIERLCRRTLTDPDVRAAVNVAIAEQEYHLAFMRCWSSVTAECVASLETSQSTMFRQTADLTAYSSASTACAARLGTGHLTTQSASQSNTVGKTQYDDN
jgi:hypothetical protein